MGIDINISGSQISGNTKVLNGLKTQGENNTDISVNNSSVSGKSQILNDANISGNSSVTIEIESSEMKEDAKVINGLDVENGQVNVKLKDVTLGEKVELMNNKKYTEKTTRTNDKKDSLLRKFLKSILKSEDVEDHREVTYSQKTHKNFEDEISKRGKLKSLDTCEAIHSSTKDAEDLKRGQKSTDKTR